MGNQSGSQVAEDVIATIDEIEEAIEELTTVQEIKLLKYADSKIPYYHVSRTKGYRGMDLLSESIKRTIEGTRHWYKNEIDFFGHLRGVISSIASRFWESYRDNEPFLESETSTTTEKGEIQSPINEAPCLTPNQEEILAAKQQLEEVRQQLEEIKKLFSEDALVLQIIEGLGCEMSGPEIQEVLNISQKEYETAMKRMRRKIRKIQNERRKQWIIN